jgi:hypothetical protein
VADPSRADDYPEGLAHQLIDGLTVMKLRVDSLQLHLREGSATPAATEETLALLEQEITSTAELAQNLRATLARSEGARDDSEACSGETDSGGRG